LTYRDLLDLRGFPRIVAGSAIQRTGVQMLQIAIVLFVLEKFHSPALAGLTVFLQVFPGLLVSPIAGALLDRYGRIRLMLLDLAVGAITIALLVFLSVSGRLSVASLLVLATISSLTAILSISGQRTLFPMIVPQPLWDRANGLDSAIYAITSIVGPPLAAGIVAIRGADAALVATAGSFALAAITLAGVPEPRVDTTARTSIWHDAWDGIRYVARNKTLRGLAVSVSLVNLGVGGLVVSIPVLILDRLHAGPAAVGWVWGTFGATSLLSALVFGRIGSVGRERSFLALSTVATVVSLVILAFAQSLWVVILAGVIEGLFLGAQDIGLFSIRQRRTDPAWFGRAFAISMSLNYMGAPFGSAISGVLVGRSIELAFLVGAGFNLLAVAAMLLMIPHHGAGDTGD
jgi:MFS family permease